MRNLIILCALALGLAATASVRAADAKANFTAKCAMCHGQDGKGETKAGVKMGAKNFTDAKVQTAMKDEEMVKAIKEGLKKDGKTKMKAYGENFSDTEIKDLVAYVRKFKQ